jgi:hypothetical protein
MRNQDWETFTGSVYCLVKLDPMQYGYALFDVPGPMRTRGMPRNNPSPPLTRTLTWVDGTTLCYSSVKQRTMNADGTATPANPQPQQQGEQQMQKQQQAPARPQQKAEKTQQETQKAVLRGPGQQAPQHLVTGCAKKHPNQQDT